ncbi:mitochondrial metallochaperone Sco1 [Trematosphaeria pertusa]|uniref:Mitochondrial metallochaperone Sco1 n=1 Tax=Trematosphaeria pertusa TaxID=390896 RepID=A0A6A6HVZ2_9PLEO|nr:mitochondrial metallochaperone Sco1 [Trematosphaeria pertusa]KAF2241723.1 mitochondrial metallochaperone Sco1 [Trematosphaeria pertusa]
MASACNCLAGVARSARASPALRVPFRTSARRTFVSSHSSSPAVSLRIAGRNDTACASKSRKLGLQEGRRARSLHEQIKSFSSSTPRQKLKTIEQVRARNKGGPFNVTAAILFVATAGALWAYFTYEKERMARKRIADQTKGMGKPKVGGPFDLIDQDGNRFTSDDMLGKYSLVYFGFTHCPDICPDELDKMALMYDKVVEKCGDVLLPIMVTCDPARDNPKVLKEYLQEFHPKFIGLTGDYEAIKQTCKAYRVYFSTPPSVKPGQDYLVDHSIYFYLMDPEGDFVEAIGRNFTADQAAKVISDHIKDWEGPLKKKDRWA